VFEHDSQASKGHVDTSIFLIDHGAETTIFDAAAVGHIPKIYEIIAVGGSSTAAAADSTHIDPSDGESYLVRVHNTCVRNEPNVRGKLSILNDKIIARSIDYCEEYRLLCTGTQRMSSWSCTKAWMSGRQPHRTRLLMGGSRRCLIISSLLPRFPTKSSVCVKSFG
jgi:hypothetical protein